MSNVVAMVLAGGRGKRMDVLCDTRPKPVLTFGGRFRVIDFTLSNCIYSGISRVAVLTDYLRGDVVAYLAGWRRDCNRSIDILEPRNGSYRGTADAVYQNLDYVKQYHADNVIVLAGDHIYRMDYRNMLAFHEQKGADVTVGVVRVPWDEVHRFGTVSLGTGGRVMQFAEKSNLQMSNMASMGIYIFSSEALRRRLTEDAIQPDSRHDFGYNIIPGMVRQDRVYAYEFSGYWRDIGTVQAYYAASKEFLDRRQPTVNNILAPVLSRRPDGFTVTVAESARVVDSILSEGCAVMGHVERSILSPGVRVGEHAIVRDSVIMDNAVIDSYSIIDHCVIDERARIGAHCFIGFGNKPSENRADITVVGRRAYIPSYTAIGSKCVIRPDVQPPDFAAGRVAPGCIISPRPPVEIAAVP